jgi:hypothetical protein
LLAGIGPARPTRPLAPLGKSQRVCTLRVCHAASRPRRYNLNAGLKPHVCPLLHRSQCVRCFGSECSSKLKMRSRRSGLGRGWHALPVAPLARRTVSGQTLARRSCPRLLGGLDTCTPAFHAHRRGPPAHSCVRTLLRYRAWQRPSICANRHRSSYCVTCAGHRAAMAGTMAVCKG